MLLCVSISLNNPESVEVYVRVENTPVPIILLKFKKITVTQPTEYPSGELTSTGAPDASWYVALEVFPPISVVNCRLSLSLLSYWGSCSVCSRTGEGIPMFGGRKKVKSNWGLGEIHGETRDVYIFLFNLGPLYINWGAVRRAAGLICLETIIT